MALRAQGTTANNSCQYYLTITDGSLNPTNVTYGAVPASSAGTTIDPGATAGVKGAYVQMTASTSAAIDQLAAIVSGRNNTAPQYTQFRLDIATGAAAAEVVVIPDLNFISNGASDVWNIVNWLLVITIASATRIAARARSGS